MKRRIVQREEEGFNEFISRYLGNRWPWLNRAKIMAIARAAYAYGFSDGAQFEMDMAERESVELVSAGVGPGHPRPKCDWCGKAFADRDEACPTCTATGYVTLCEACYNSAGNSVR